MDKTLAKEDTYALLKQVCEGNKDAFDVLYSRYWKEVYNAVYKRLENPARSQDAVQDIFLQLWIQMAVKKSTGDIQNFSAFLATLAKNHVFKIWQREKKYIPISTLLVELNHFQAGNCDDSLLHNELLKTFHRALEQLPEQQQKIFRMYYLNEQSSIEIAEMLNISPKTVRNQLARAAKKLRPIFILLSTSMITEIV